MDIAGLILNLVGVARGIHTFLDETKSKKEKFRQLEWRVLSLIEILSPLASRNQSKALLHLQERYQIGIIFMELAEILGCIRERILAHNNHSGFGGIMDFVNPTVLLGKLEDDEKRLSRWIEIFGLHLQIAQRLSCISQQPTSSLAVARAERVRRVNDHVRTTDVARFWNNCIGMEIKHVTPAVFFVAMNGWLRRRLEDVEYASIYLEFDPEDSGIVTKARVFQVVGSLPLGTFVYEHERRASNHLRDLPLDKGCIKKNAEPLIVWIDDQIVEGDFRIQQTKSQGIRVVLLPSTAAAKAWIKAHDVSLRRLEAAGALQFITDNVRWEETEASRRVVMNVSAGETMLRFVRGNRFIAPVLVYCKKSVGATGFVTSYRNAASTSAYQVFKDFATMPLRSQQSLRAEWALQSRLSSGYDIHNLRPLRFRRG